MIPVIYELARSQARVVLTRSVNLASGIITPLMFMALLTLPRLERLDPAQATSVFTGVLLASFWSASLWSGAGILRRERWLGTLATSFTGNVSPYLVLLAKTLGGVVFDVGLIAVTNTAFVAIFRVDMRIAHPVAFGIGIVAVIVCGVASSMLLGSVLILSRHAFQLTLLVGAPITLIGGTIIPHSLLPNWLAVIANVINLPWLQRYLVSTTTDVDWGALGVAVAISAAYAGVGWWCMRILLRRARKDGSLELA